MGALMGKISVYIIYFICIIIFQDRSCGSKLPLLITIPDTYQHTIQNVFEESMGINGKISI